jgi:hypothetical protein
MKFKNCGVIATKAIFLKDQVSTTYGDDIIPTWIGLQGTIGLLSSTYKKGLTMSFIERLMCHGQFCSTLKLCE